MTSIPDQIKNIRSTVNGYKLSQLLITAEQIGVFSVLGDSAMNSHEIVQNTNTVGDHTLRLLNALVSAGVLDLSAGKYKLEAKWSLLSPQSKSPQGGYLRYAAVVKSRWAELADALRGDDVASESVNLISGGSPDATKAFIDAMDSNARPVARYVADTWEFSSRTALDVGGGSAIYPIEITRRYKNFNAVVLDLPGVTPIAKSAISNAGMNNTIEVVDGDYNESLPDGEYDDIFMFAIIHQQGIESNEKLLSRAKRHLKKKGRLFITSFFVNDAGTAPPFSAFFGVEMSVMVPGGRTYSLDEVHHLIEESGFSEILVDNDVPGPGTLIVATVD